jgi:hypothetical protein
MEIRVVLEAEAVLNQALWEMPLELVEQEHQDRATVVVMGVQALIAVVVVVVKAVLAQPVAQTELEEMVGLE